jgi:hypothetical protein
MDVTPGLRAMQGRLCSDDDDFLVLKLTAYSLRIAD